jgi:hypothetical protein
MHFRLLDLPAELRIASYRATHLDGLTICIHGASPVPPALARACRQIRHEYLPVFEEEGLALAIGIRATVKNFDFRNIYSFTRRYPRPRNAPLCEMIVRIELIDPRLAKYAHWIRWDVRCGAGELDDYRRRYDVVVNWSSVNAGGKEDTSRLTPYNTLATLKMLGGLSRFQANARRYLMLDHEKISDAILGLVEEREQRLAGQLAALAPLQ